VTRGRPGIPPDETGGVVAARNRRAQRTVPLPGYRQMEGTLNHPPGRAGRRLHGSREYASTAGGDVSVVGCMNPRVAAPKGRGSPSWPDDRLGVASCASGLVRAESLRPLCLCGSFPLCLCGQGVEVRLSGAPVEPVTGSVKGSGSGWRRSWAGSRRWGLRRSR
jgi:hypothetical protein